MLTASEQKEEPEDFNKAIREFALDMAANRMLDAASEILRPMGLPVDDTAEALTRAQKMFENFMEKIIAERKVKP